MRAEIISIGDELITGQRLDTNSQWLAERLTELGVEVAFHTTVGDRLDDNIAVLHAAIARADVVVVTGGLGPTADDLTREALAAAAGVELVRDEASLEHIRRLFASRGREMPPRNAVQADFPAGATPIFNEHGTAPGIFLEAPRSGAPPCLVFALPGVPAEMRPMWQESVASRVRAAQGGARVIRHRRVKCFGVGESQLEAMLPDLIRRGREPSVGITVSDATITLRVTAAGVDEETCFVAMEPTLAIIHESLATIAYGDEDDELEDVVVRLLRERGQTVAVAEAATGGRVSQALARADQSGQTLADGVVFGSVAQLARLLGQPELVEAGEDDAALAQAAAEAVRKAAGADYGLGIAQWPTDPDRADAHLYIAIATPERTRRLRFGAGAHPAIRQVRAAKQMLNALRLILLTGETSDS